MTTQSVVLSDEQACEVNRLGIFDLDGVGDDILGVFTYTFKLANGQEVTEEYDIRRLTKVPQHPGVPEHEIVEHSPAWYALLEYQTYKMAVAHEKGRIESMIEYVYSTSRKIAESLDPDDWTRIEEEEDYLKVCEAGLVKQLTPELMADVFRRYFHAHFQGQDIFDALERVQPGSGGYDALRVWEINTMTATGYTEEAWAGLDLMERGRKVGAAQLPKLLEALEADKRAKDMERDRLASEAASKAGK